MERNGRRWFSGFAAGLVLVTLPGCVDSGLPDRNLALEEAENRQFRYAVYDTRAEAETIFRHEDADWAVAGTAERIPAAYLVAVGTAGTHGLFVLATDPPPYDRLYVETERGWMPYARVGSAGTGAPSGAPH
jgi:hypothetical protein